MEELMKEVKIFIQELGYMTTQEEKNKNQIKQLRIKERRVNIFIKSMVGQRQAWKKESVFPQILILYLKNG